MNGKLIDFEDILLVFFSLETLAFEFFGCECARARELQLFLPCSRFAYILLSLFLDFLRGERAQVDEFHTQESRERKKRTAERKKYPTNEEICSQKQISRESIQVEKR